MPTITLQTPPSINALWRSNRGRVHKSYRYAAWQKSAGWDLKLQRPGRVPGPVKITVAVGRASRRRIDLDNICAKAILDLLVRHGVLEDDSKVTSLAARWDDAVSAGMVKVTVEPALAAVTGETVRS